jgi:hypothetical protein
MRDWESQELPGILEGVPSVPMHVPYPDEAISEVVERLTLLRDVQIPDWIDGSPESFELAHASYAIALMVRRLDEILIALVGEREVS